MRFREHFQDFKYTNNKSKFAQHLSEKGHSFGPIDDRMETLHIANKGRMLDTLERFTFIERHDETIRFMIN